MSTGSLLMKTLYVAEVVVELGYQLSTRLQAGGREFCLITGRLVPSQITEFIITILLFTRKRLTTHGLFYVITLFSGAVAMCVVRAYNRMVLPVLTAMAIRKTIMSLTRALDISARVATQAVSWVTRFCTTTMP